MAIAGVQFADLEGYHAEAGGTIAGPPPGLAADATGVALPRQTAAAATPMAAPKATSLGKWAEEATRWSAAQAAIATNTQRPCGYLQARAVASPAATAACPEGKLISSTLFRRAPAGAPPGTIAAAPRPNVSKAD